MMFTVAVALILSLLVRSSSQECGGNTRQLISDPDVLIIISANPVLEGANAKVDPSQVEISESNTNSWCSAEPQGGVPYDPYLIFEFNSTYLIDIVKISGGNEQYTYVRTLSIKNDTGQGFAFISNNGIPKVFDTLLTNGNDVRNISFMDNPVLATSLQIRPLNWSTYIPCMKIELYGCLYNNSDHESYRQDSKTNITSNDTERVFDSSIIVAVGIGGTIFGALVATTTILAIGGVVHMCCCKKIRPMDARERIYSTSNEAYGIAQKYNIELQANECYKPVSPPAEQASTSQHDDSEYTYPVLPQ